MTQTAINYAEVLYGLSVSEKSIQVTEQIFREVPEVKEILENPVVRFDNKEEIINRIFPESIQSFLKAVCRYHKISQILDILEAYHDYCRKKNGVLNATLYYVTVPREEQLEKIKGFLCQKYGKKEVDHVMVKDETLVGGFVLRAENQEYDWSLKGRFKKLEQSLIRR